MTSGATADAREANIPRRVLLVDDDELVIQPIANLLVGAGFEVKLASDGEEALALLSRYWFPVVLTDWHMPIMDGLEFVQRLRALAVESSYVIMLTVSDSGADYERGYCAGVDQYVSKHSAAEILLKRVQAGFQAIVMRRTVRQARAVEDLITVDLESGAHTPRHLIGRLQVEMKRAQRLESSVAMICVGIDPDTGVSEAAAQHSPGSVARTPVPHRVTVQQLTAVFSAIRGTLSKQKDWVARLPGGQCAHRLALILPEANAAQAAAVTQSIRNAFVMTDKAGGAAAREPKLSFGTAVFPLEAGASAEVAVAGAGTAGRTALEFLNASERGRRGMEPVWPAVTEAAPKAAADGPAVVAEAPLAAADEAPLAGSSAQPIAAESAVENSSSAATEGVPATAKTADATAAAGG